MGVAWRSAEHGEDPQVSASTWLSQGQRTRPNPPERVSVEPISPSYMSYTHFIPSDALNFPDPNKCGGNKCSLTMPLELKQGPTQRVGCNPPHAVAFH